MLTYDVNAIRALVDKVSSWAAVGLVLAIVAFFSGAASAQEVLPAPPTPFKGEIGLSAKDSKPDFPKPIQAPAGAPNIVLVLWDDAGARAQLAQTRVPEDTRAQAATPHDGWPYAKPRVSRR